MKKLLVFLLCALFVLPMAACQSGGGNETAAKNPTCEEVLGKIIESVGQDNLPAMGDFDDDILSMLYGLTAADVLDDYRGSLAMINVRADEILVMKVKDGKMADVEAAIEQRKADLDATWSMYLPDVYEVVKDARVVKNGNYILFVVSEHADKAVAAFDEMTK